MSHDQPEDPLLEGVEGAEAGDKGTYGFVADLARKVALAGMGAFFMTEEGVRHLAAQLKVPKEALHYVVSQAEKTKEELGRVLSEEIRRFFQSETLRSEFLKVLSGMTVEIKAEVRMVPRQPEGDGQAVAPKVEVVAVKARRGKRKKE